MRSLTAIFTTVSLPLYVYAAHYANWGDRHSDLAVRARGDVLQKRGFSGPFTLYDITVGLTACGGSYGSNDNVVAINQGQFGSGTQICGTSITLSFNGVTVSATIEDKCMGCGANGLDLTVGLFKQLSGGSTAAGVLQGSWSFGSGSAPKAAPTPTTTSTTPIYTPPTASSTPNSPIPTPTPTPTPSTTSSSSPSAPSSSSASASVSASASTSMSTSSNASASTNPTTPTSTSYALPSASGFAQPVGTVNGGQTEALQSVYDIIVGMANIVRSVQP